MATRLASTAGCGVVPRTTDVPSFTVADSAATYASVSSGSGIGRDPIAAPLPPGISPLSEYGYLES